MKKPVSLAVLTAVASLEASSAAHAAPIRHGSTTTQTTTKKYKGPVVDMRWGPVQAMIYVKNKKITKVTVGVSPDTNRSQFIDDNAVPLLQQETLQAQNAKIDVVSGATMTSEAFIQSLHAVVKKAKHDKTLK